MCGIAGFISKGLDSPENVRHAVLERMCESIRHRGPDEQGMTVEGRAALGMRRLSIIDIKSGQQPIVSEEGRLTIVFNGEIYNFQELRKELESYGCTFKTNSDTEVVLRAYEKFGSGSLQMLRGMFALAIWNSDEETLFLARDRVGKKPLFYCNSGEGDFVFGSELKALLAHGQVPKDVDLEALDAYLTFGYVPEELCIFPSVRKLQPGHFLIFKNGEASTEKYWDFEISTELSDIFESDLAEDVRAKVMDAVRVRLVSEVPLGAFLSGGVDSSAVVGMMARLSSRPVQTFSIGFEEDSFNELRYARIAAKHFRTEHHEFVVTPDMIDVVDSVVCSFDEPFADPSSMPTFLLSKMAREYVTVVLSGDGGDEVFGGYTRYTSQQDWGRKILPDFAKGSVRSLSAALPHWASGKNYLYNISLDPTNGYIHNISHFNCVMREALYTTDFKKSLSAGFDRATKDFKDLAARFSGSDDIGRLLLIDSKTYLPGDILTKVDRMTMANSLEARSPLLDQELIELAAGIPTRLKVNGSVTKYIFKKSMEGIVPNDILYREKQGFGVPIEQWINDKLRERVRETVLEPRALNRGYFSQEYLNTLFDEHSRGRRDHSYRLWALFMLELWHREYID